MHDLTTWADTMLKGAPKPPPGFSPIPNSKHGGYHKQEGGKWVSWYPTQGHADKAHAHHSAKAASHTERIDHHVEEAMSAHQRGNQAGKDTHNKAAMRHDEAAQEHKQHAKGAKKALIGDAGSKLPPPTDANGKPLKEGTVVWDSKAKAKTRIDKLYVGVNGDQRAKVTQWGRYGKETFSNVNVDKKRGYWTQKGGLGDRADTLTKGAKANEAIISARLRQELGYAADTLDFRKKTKDRKAQAAFCRDACDRVIGVMVREDETAPVIKGYLDSNGYDGLCALAMSLLPQVLKDHAAKYGSSEGTPSKAEGPAAVYGAQGGTMLAINGMGFGVGYSKG